LKLKLIRQAQSEVMENHSDDVAHDQFLQESRNKAMQEWLARKDKEKRAKRSADKKKRLQEG